jgi:hypothetical protein
MNDTHKCSVCQCNFSLDGEGGIDGYIGILYFALCPTCLSVVQDMCDQLRGYDEEIEE